MFQVRMLGDSEIPAESVNPIAWFTHEILPFFVLPILMLMAGHVVFLVRLSAVENRGIIAAVKIDVRLGEQMIGEQVPAISQQDLHHAVLAALAPVGRFWPER